MMTLSGLAAAVILMVLAAYVVSRPLDGDEDPPARQSYACPRKHEWAVVFAEDAPPRCPVCRRTMWKTGIVTPETCRG